MKNLELCECGKIAIDTRVSTWDDAIRFYDIEKLNNPNAPKHSPKNRGGCNDGKSSK
jgi:hypothetical protein